MKINVSICDTCVFFEHECGMSESGLCLKECRHVRERFYDSNKIKECIGYKRRE